jgi:hypothetical protein
METRESLSAFIDKILSGDSPLAARMALPNGRLPFSPMRNSVYKQLLKTVDPKSPYYQKGDLLKKKILNRVFPEYKTPKGWSVKGDNSV